MKKKLLIAGGVLGGLVLAGLFIGYMMLNNIVRLAVEKNATQSLKVQTQLGRASVAPFAGDVSLTDLRVASPEGFTAGNMFMLGHLKVEVSYSELFGAPVKVASVTIDKPRLVIEQAGGKLNFMELAKNLKSDKPAPAPGDKSEPIKVIINQIQMSGAEVVILPGIPGLDKPITLTIPPINLSNIGNADGAQTGEEIGRVVTELVQAIAQKAAESDRVPPQVRELLKLDLTNLRAELQGRLESEIDKAKGKAIDEINKGIGDILGGKKKDN
jgi:uncharacterized protein involved in outer membrane biogenesis